jgi:hypothetical protein
MTTATAPRPQAQIQTAPKAAKTIVSVEKDAKSLYVPNKKTIEAMEELDNGKGIRFETVSDLFKSI